MEAATAGKVVSIAAGEAHTLALTEDNRVFSWGRGMFGRLGTGSEADQLSPVEVNFGISQIKLVGVSAGAYHSLALADDGSVWSWGYNVYGQLGTDGENSATPVLLKEFKDESSSTTNSESPPKICSVKAGGMMSAAIDDRGDLWLWGNYPQPSGGSKSESEGVFCLASSFTPAIVRGFSGQAVVKVACGNEHVVALGDGKLVYSWGGNKDGQLGLGDTENRAFPEIVPGFGPDSQWEAHEASCGGFHTALLARHKGSSENSVWTFGLGENGQLGLGTTLSSATPRRVESLPVLACWVSVGCGLFHTSAVSDSGKVFSWGMERGLGLCPDARVGAESGDAVSPVVVEVRYGESERDRPIQVVCGAAHTVLVACGGRKLWSWGRGRSGVLGNGESSDCLTPTPVRWPEEEVKEEEKKSKTDDDAPTEEGETDKEGLEGLERKLEATERYASVLHRAIFGKELKERDLGDLAADFNVAKEWDKMLEESGRAELVGLEMFYRSMLSGVKDQLMKRRIREVLNECLGSMSKGT